MSQSDRASVGQVVRTHVRRYHDTYTLIEIILMLGSFALLSSMLVSYFTEDVKLTDTSDAKRSFYERQLSQSMYEYLIEHWELPASVKIPAHESRAVPICKQGVLDDPTCVNVDVLVPEYLAKIPHDEGESKENYTGYGVYTQNGAPIVVSAVTGGEKRLQLLGNCYEEIQNASYVLDDADRTFKSSENDWERNADGWKSGSLTSGIGTPASATWTAVTKETGDFNLFVRWEKYSSHGSAMYTISDASGETDVLSINQSLEPQGYVFDDHLWQYVGTYVTTEGDPVIHISVVSDGKRTISADALILEYTDTMQRKPRCDAGVLSDSDIPPRP